MWRVAQLHRTAGQQGTSGRERSGSFIKRPPVLLSQAGGIGQLAEEGSYISFRGTFLYYQHPPRDTPCDIVHPDSPV